jgi:hypothetical protein
MSRVEKAVFFENRIDLFYRFKNQSFYIPTASRTCMFNRLLCVARGSTSACVVCVVDPS